MSVDLRRHEPRPLDRPGRTAWRASRPAPSGRQIAEQLGRHGFTLGHEPDSLEFSTLGGWIATNASGMKKNRYGNIEDLVLDVDVGDAATGDLARAGAAARIGRGAIRARWMFGSEGQLGIVTQRGGEGLPAARTCRRYGSVLFRELRAGVALPARRAARGRRCRPACAWWTTSSSSSARRCKPRASAARRRARARSRSSTSRACGLRPRAHGRLHARSSRAARAEVAAQERSRLSRSPRGTAACKAGAANGERGYQLTFAIAYIRDFMIDHCVLAESFETSVPWSQTRRAVRQREAAHLAGAREARAARGARSSPRA